jgi:hypothetical protein
VNTSELEHIEPGEDTNLGGVTLYLEHLEEIVSIISGVGLEGEWELGRRAGRRLGAFAEELGPGPYRRGVLTTSRHGTTAFTLEFGPTGVQLGRLMAFRDADGVRAARERIRDLIRREQGALERVNATILIPVAVVVAGAGLVFYAVDTFADPPVPTWAALGAAALLMAAVLLTDLGSVRGPARLYLVRRRAHQSWWARNGDELIRNLIGGAILLGLGWLLGQLFPAP